jgi:hypothetical protein
MTLTRQRTAEDYAQIAFALPSEFIHIHASLTPEQCRAIVKVYVHGKNVIDIFENDSNSRHVLIFILNNLKSEQIDLICLRKDRENKTLLHRLAAVNNNSIILDILYSKISPDAFSTILSMQDNSKKTVLHYQASLCSITIFKTLLAKTKIAVALNSACLLQDSDGRTFLHHFADLSYYQYIYYKALLNTLSDEAFLNSVVLLDFKKYNMLYYLLDIGKGAKITHQKGKSAQAVLHSEAGGFFRPFFS